MGEERKAMALITWSPQHSVGVERLDKEHSVLVDVLNDLHAAMKKGSAEDATEHLFWNLLEYTRSHFCSEETMMTRTGYPGLADHRATHSQLMKKIENYRKRIDRGKLSIDLDMLDFLRDWLIRHIQCEDRDLGRWMNEHGRF